MPVSGVDEWGESEFGEQGGDGFVVRGAGHAVDTHGEGVGRLVGLEIGGGYEEFADQGAGFFFLLQVRDQQAHERGFGAAGDHFHRIGQDLVQGRELSGPRVFGERLDFDFLGCRGPLGAPFVEVGLQFLNAFELFGAPMDVGGDVEEGGHAEFGLSFAHLSDFLGYLLFETAPGGVYHEGCARNLFASVWHKSIFV